MRGRRGGTACVAVVVRWQPQDRRHSGSDIHQLPNFPKLEAVRAIISHGATAPLAGRSVSMPHATLSGGGNMPAAAALVPPHDAAAAICRAMAAQVVQWWRPFTGIATEMHGCCGGGALAMPTVCHAGAVGIHGIRGGLRHGCCASHTKRRRRRQTFVLLGGFPLPLTVLVDRAPDARVGVAGGGGGYDRPLCFLEAFRYR